MNAIARTLIVFGIILILSGFLLLFAGRFFPYFGHLPGDIVLTRKNTTIFFPFTTMLVVSIVLTIVLNLLSRWMK